ncbi:LOW QUALITY PROTEIN: vitellogenin 3, phosvitinless [Megalobrama amblycephala]|uniref:LOW QUALITY PROTEIN: vitellogenin 3, phosvitinless n=1 Tax=Megalobrama amblycephala TaxID=75352 RepID=UPI002013F6E6|nr:LOW QUALITY PROTEIN: vitellogenin 3, phosvitinless [Megalobrama amblycephala]
MWWLYLCLLVPLAASETVNYEPFLNSKKTYEYKYEGLVRVGRELPDLVESALKLRCTFKIIGESPQTFVLQISNVDFEDFNGIPGKGVFSPSQKLTKRLSAEFSQPIVFEFSKGQISDIRTAPGVSNSVVNIVRGILGFLQVTVKTTQSFYELVELGIHGVCQSSYTVEEDSNAKELIVTQMVDITNCQQPAALYSGMALAPEDKLSKQRGENVVSTVKHTYTVKSTADGGLITKAFAQERQYFSPFNVKGGNSRMLALRDIELLKVSDTADKIVTGQVQSRGNLMYKTEKDLKPIPVVMINLNNPAPKILDLIKRLTQANIYHVDSASSTDILDLIQLLRVETLENLEQLWKQVSGNDEHRRWFLDLVVEATDERILKFLETRFKVGDITANEAGQALVVAFNHLSAEPVSVALAQEFLTIPFSKSQPLLWNTVVLAYGSLLYRYCVYTDPCPVTVVQPLLDMAASSLSKNSEEDMVLTLKALGNAAHPSSIKTLLKFLPGYSAGAEKLPTRVQGAAVQAFRLLAGRDPHSVQDIVLNLFIQKNLPAEIRMLACMVLLETKPSIALISVITEVLLEEIDLQVASFSYSLLKGIAKSRTPDNQHLSTACNVAMKILTRKLGHLSYRYSKSMHFDWFHDDFLFGTSTDVYILQNESLIPSKLMLKGKIHFIGRILQCLELGVHADGIKELFAGKIPQLKKDLGVTDFATILKILSDWQNLPKDKPLLTAYIRLFGQEAFLMDVSGDFIQSITKSFSPSAGKESKVWEKIQDVQKGISWHWTKPHLVYEARFIQPTCLGLPVEISKYFSIVNAVTMKAKAEINPPPKEHLDELLRSDISLQTDGFAGVTKDHFVFHGINIDLFQCGVELKSKIVTSLPWAFGLKINIKEQKYEMNLTPSKTDTELFSVNSNVFTVSRNIEDPSLSKITPMMPETENSQQGLPLARRILPTSRDEQTEDNEVKFRQCAEAKIYGTAICIEAEAKRSHYLHEYPLYYFLGHTRFSYQLEPAKNTKPIEKIQIQVTAGMKRPPGVSEMMDLSRRVFKDTRDEIISCGEHNLSSSFPANQDLDSTPDPVITVKALGLSPPAKPLGYECVAFYLPTAQRDDIEMIVSEVGEEANWKMCANANVDKSYSSAKAHLRWGAECQTYDVSMRVSSAASQSLKPSIYTKINWGALPSMFTTIGQRIQEYVPGMSYFMGFYQKYEKNPERQAAVTVVASSPETFDMKVKIPERTIYKKAIPSPIELVGFEAVNLTMSA